MENANNPDAVSIHHAKPKMPLSSLVERLKTTLDSDSSCKREHPVIQSMNAKNAANSTSNSELACDDVGSHECDSDDESTTDCGCGDVKSKDCDMGSSKNAAPKITTVTTRIATSENATDDCDDGKTVTNIHNRSKDSGFGSVSDVHRKISQTEANSDHDIADDDEEEDERERSKVKPTNAERNSEEQHESISEQNTYNDSHNDDESQQGRDKDSEDGNDDDNSVKEDDDCSEDENCDDSEDDEESFSKFAAMAKRSARRNSLHINALGLFREDLEDEDDEEDEEEEVEEDDDSGNHSSCEGEEEEEKEEEEAVNNKLPGRSILKSADKHASNSNQRNLTDISHCQENMYATSDSAKSQNTPAVLNNAHIAGDRNETHGEVPNRQALIEIARNELSVEVHSGRPRSRQFVNVLGVTAEDSDLIENVDGVSGKEFQTNGAVKERSRHSNNDNNNSASEANMNNFSKLLGLNGKATHHVDDEIQSSENTTRADDCGKGAKGKHTGKWRSKNFKCFTLPLTKKQTTHREEIEDPIPTSLTSVNNHGGKHLSFKGSVSGLSRKLDPRKLRGIGDGSLSREATLPSTQTTGNEHTNDGDLCDCCPASICNRVNSLPGAGKVREWMESNVLEGHEVRNTVVIGIAFQLIFTAHYAIQNLQSSLHEEHYLGATALGCLYAASIFSSIFAPTILGFLGTKRTLVIAWACQILYTLAQFYPSWGTLVPASVILGSVMGPTWTVQGIYVSACAYSFSKRSKESPYSIMSRFQGIFFTLFETRQILGNILSSGVLKHGINNATEEEIEFRFCGPQDCPYYENVTNLEEPHPQVLSGMLGIFIALQIMALLLTIFLVAPLPKAEWSARRPLRETATSWLRTLIGTKMLFLVPFMIFQAMQQGILLSEYTKSYVSCPIGIHMVGFVMATHGATSAIFVFIFSRLARLTGRFPLFSLAAIISLVFLVVLYEWTPTSDQEALIFFFPVLFGVGEGIWQTQTNAMIAVSFWSQRESAFANYQTWRAVGFTLILGCHRLLCVSTNIAITLGFLVVGMGLYTGVEVYTRWKSRLRVPKAQDGPSNTASPNGLSVEAMHRHKDSEPAFGTSTPRYDDAEGGFTFPIGDPLTETSLESLATTTSDGKSRASSYIRRETSVHESTKGRKKGLSLKDKFLRSRSVPSNIALLNTSATQHSDIQLPRSLSTSSSSTTLPRPVSVVVMTEEEGGRIRDSITLDGAILEEGESPYLDKDLRRYGMAKAPGRRPITSVTSTISSISTSSYHPHTNSNGNTSPLSSPQEAGDDDSVWLEDGDLISPRLKPHSWPDNHFQDEGELRVVWTKDDVYVF